MKETKTHDPPECFTPEPDNPYPLCIGKDTDLAYLQKIYP